MPPERTQFTIGKDDLQKAIDVDASDGRSVPTNMNFVDEGYLTKDTGFSLFGDSTSEMTHSICNFKKKDGTSYIIRAKGTYLQKYNAGTWENLSTGTATMTLASPGVVSLTAHGLKAGSKFSFETTGALPTGVTAGTTYYVIATGLTADAFQFSTTAGGSAVNTSGSQSGTHTLYRRFTEGAEFGWLTYDDTLYGGNAVENFFTFTGTAFTEYDTAPKGNIFEVFEDRVFVTGVIAEPYTAYYSNVNAGTTFTPTDLIKPLGTDTITNLKNYYGSLLIFKEESIWKLTFIYDQVVSLFVPKLEVQSTNYGACSRKAVSWVENDIWFYTGREVRSIGYVDQQTGILGVNKSVISENIKETLKLVEAANFSKIIVFYKNRRFYLGIPLNADTVDTLFVCHLLYGMSWTKYANRYKANVNNFMEIDEDIYTCSSSIPFGTIKWDTSKNEVTVQTIYKEDFATDPVDRGWTIGTDWEYDAVNDRMKVI